MMRKFYDSVADHNIMHFTLDELIALVPVRSPQIIEKLGDWSDTHLKLIRQFPGVDPDYERGENAKYRRPRIYEGLTAGMMTLLETARVHWSRDVVSWTTNVRLSFRDWLPGYLECQSALNFDPRSAPKIDPFVLHERSALARPGAGRGCGGPAGADDRRTPLQA